MRLNADPGVLASPEKARTASIGNAPIVSWPRPSYEIQFSGAAGRFAFVLKGHGFIPAENERDFDAGLSPRKSIFQADPLSIHAYQSQPRLRTTQNASASSS